MGVRMTDGRTGGILQTVGHMVSNRETPSCGLISLDVFKDPSSFGLSLELALGVLCGWVNEWRADGQEDFDCKRRTYGTQPIDSILLGCCLLMSPCVFLRLLVIIGIEFAAWLGE